MCFPLTQRQWERNFLRTLFLKLSFSMCLTLALRQLKNKSHSLEFVAEHLLHKLGILLSIERQTHRRSLRGAQQHCIRQLDRISSFIARTRQRALAVRRCHKVVIENAEHIAVVRQVDDSRVTLERAHQL